MGGRAVNRLIQTLAFGFCWMLAAKGDVRAEDVDQVLRDRFLRAVPQTARIVEQISFRAKIVSTRDFETVSDSIRAKFKQNKIDCDKPDVEELNCAIRGSLGLTTGVGRSGVEYVAVRNGDYAFRIARSSAVKSYSLAYLERLGDNPDRDNLIQQQYDEARCFALGTWCLNEEPVSHVVESPSFQIKQVTAEKRDGEDLVRIEFDRKYTDPTQRAWSFSDAFLVCDPERHWALKEYGWTGFDAGIYRTTVTFGESVDGFPLAKGINRRNRSTDDPTVARQVITVEISSLDVPKEEFFLSHYGLPEPTFQTNFV